MTRSKRSHSETNSSTPSRALGSSIIRRVTRSIPSGVFKSPRAALSSSASSGAVSQMKYARLDAFAYGFHFGLGVPSSQKMKLGDCSMVSITACAPARKFFSALKIA